MNRHMFIGITLLLTWLIVVWYGFDSFALEESIFKSVKIMPAAEKYKVLLWLTVSVTILALAIKTITRSFVPKENKKNPINR